MGMKDPTVIAIFIVDGREIYQIGHADYPYITAYERNGDVFTKIEEKGVCNCFKDWETQGICRFCTKTLNFHLENIEAMASNIKERGGYCGHEKDGEAGNLCPYCLCRNSNCSNRHSRNRRFWDNYRRTAEESVRCDK